MIVVHVCQSLGVNVIFEIQVFGLNIFKSLLQIIWSIVVWPMTIWNDKPVLSSKLTEYVVSSRLPPGVHWPSLKKLCLQECYTRWINKGGLNELLEKWTPDPITWVFWGVIHMASGDIRWPGENFTVCQVVGEVFLVQEALPTHWRSWGPCGERAAKCSRWEGFAKINAFPLGSKLEFKRVVPITLWAGNLLDDEDQFWSRNGRYSPQHREVLLMQL